MDINSNEPTKPDFSSDDEFDVEMQPTGERGGYEKVSRLNRILDMIKSGNIKINVIEPARTFNPSDKMNVKDKETGEMGAAKPVKLLGYAYSVAPDGTVVSFMYDDDQGIHPDTAEIMDNEDAAKNFA